MSRNCQKSYNEPLSKFIVALASPSKSITYCIARIRGAILSSNYTFGNPWVRCGSKLLLYGKISLTGKGTIIIGNFVHIEGGPFGINTFNTYRSKATITIGDHSFLNGVRISCHRQVIIGKWCLIANAQIADNDGHAVTPNRWDPTVTVPSRPVTIEDNVWICRNALILKNVTIGKNSVIGANSVVTKDIPPNCVAAGNPATVIRKFTDDEVALAERFFVEKNLLSTNPSINTQQSLQSNFNR